MTERPGLTSSSRTLAGMTAVVLARVVVPLWLLTGAVLKLVDASPSHLPVPLIKASGALGLDLVFVLRFSIAVELIVVVVMWLLPRLARPVGLLMLTAFLPVLVADVAMGASSCGCFGAVEVHPAITLTMDLGFLLGLWLLGRGVESLAWTRTQPTWRVLVAGLFSLVSVAAAFGLTNGQLAAGHAPGQETPNPGTPGVANPGTSVATTAVPAEGYYLPTYDQWLGRPWDEVPVSAWIQGGPEDAGAGDRFVLFYRKDCEHCHHLMELYFTGTLPVPTTAVAVPDRGGFPTEGTQPFVCDQCDLAELPSGVDWFLQTPVLVKLTDGVVECAAEVTAEDPECMAW